MKQQMVLGFLFSHDLKRVVLIEKKKPEWQLGKLNGIGGKIEENESPIDAMCREFLEETGIETDREDWLHFASMNGDTFIVECFYTLSTRIDGVETLTDEEVKQIFISELNDFKIVSNLSWLIPLAINHWNDSKMDKADIIYKW